MREGENVLRGMMVAGWTIKEDIIKNGFGILRTSSQMKYGRHDKIIGRHIRRNIITEVIFKIRT